MTSDTLFTPRGFRLDKREDTQERVGDYRVVRKLATSSDRDVLLAVDSREANVILKVLRAKGDGITAFARACDSYARLNHPAVVRLLRWFSHGDDVVMVLEYVDGVPLHRLRAAQRVPLDDTGALYIAGGIFEALAAAHAATDEAGDSAPLVHRDVNPSSVLLGWAGDVKLTGFGTAKDDRSRATLVRPSTYGYLAPEQVKGEIVTPRADVYSAAIVLWELLTKRRAFLRGVLPESDALRALAQPRIASIDVLRPDLDVNLREALKRALEPRPERRMMTAEEMLAVLRAIVPEPEGREQVVPLLDRVPRDRIFSRTSIPPALAALDDAETQKMMRMPSTLRPPEGASAVPVPRPSSAKARESRSEPESPARTRRFEKGMPSPNLSLEEIASVMEQGASTTGVPASSKLLERGDSVSTEAGGRGAALSSPDDSPRGSPLAAFATGVPLRDAIDEIIGDLGAPVPPARGGIPSRTAPTGTPAQERASSREGTPVARESRPSRESTPAARESRPSRESTPAARESRPPRESNTSPRERWLSDPNEATLQAGRIPPAPPAFDGTLRSTAPLMPSSFPQASRTLTMSERVDLPSTNADPPGKAAATRSTQPMTPFPPPAAGTTAPMHAVVPMPPAVSATATAGQSSPAVPARSVMQSGAPPSVEPRAGAEVRPASSRVAWGVGALLLVVLGTGVAISRYAAVGDASSTHEIPPRTPAATEHPRPSLGGPMAPPSQMTTEATSSSGSAVASARAVSSSESASSDMTAASSTAAPAAASSSLPAPPIASSSAVLAAASSSAGRSPPSGSASAPARATSSAVAPTVSAIPAGMGRVDTAGSVPGRRIFVEDHAVAQTPTSVLVKCGSRRIRLGSAGTTQQIDVPCGGQILVGDR